MRNEDEFDRIMSEEEILPSSGFAASVMEAVRREAAAPPPIAFPWKRALPGIVFAGATLVTILVICTIKVFDSSSVQPSASVWQALMQVQAHWVLLGLAVMLVAWKMPALLGFRS